MQIRAGNRQDEDKIRTIIFNAMKECGLEPEPEGREDDLKNIEAGYFWHDGIFVVAERDGTIIGVAGGRKNPEAGCDTELELIRLAVLPSERKHKVARQLLDTIMFFAGNSVYERVILRTKAKVIPGVLEKLGFAEDPSRATDAGPVYSQPVAQRASCRK
ncbi:MAG: GNAT family N-acetyltransferase [Candidatus Obscuribacterales bacterium]